MLDQALTDSWGFFKRHLGALSVLVLPIVIPLQVAMSWYGGANPEQEMSPSEMMVTTVLGLAVYAFYLGAVIFYIASVTTGERRSTAELYRLALRYWAPLLLLMFLVAFAVFGGFMLLVVPGVLLMLKLAFAEFDLLLNGSSPTDAWKTSWELTKNRKGTLFGGYLIITLAIYVPMFVIEFLLAGFQVTHWAVYATTATVTTMCNLFYTIFAFRVYDLTLAKKREEAELEMEDESADLSLETGRDSGRPGPGAE